MSCGMCGPSSKKEETKKPKYKCSSCGSTSEESGECCGQPREKLCGCGSGKLAKNCCEE